MNTLKPPEDVIFFIDRSLGGKTVPQALIAAGEKVKILDDEFPSDTSDEKWLQQVAQKGWAVLTHDKKIQYRINEKTAVMRNRVCLFVLTYGGNLSGKEVAQIIIDALPAIKKALASNPPPFIAKILRGGSVRMVT